MRRILARFVGVHNSETDPLQTCMTVVLLMVKISRETRAFNVSRNMETLSEIRLGPSGLQIRWGRGPTDNETDTFSAVVSLGRS